MGDCCDIDHVIVAVRDLDTAADRFLAEYGLASVAGGRHPGHGTANRIVPLGGAYLELMAVLDRGEAAASRLGTAVAAATEEGDGAFALCLRTDDIGSVASRLGLEPVPMTRRRPDGVELAWTLAGLECALGPERLPFFIEWHVAPGDHPAEIHIDHPGGAASLGRVRISGDARRIVEWVGREDPLIEVEDGTPGIASVEIVVGGEAFVVA